MKKLILPALLIVSLIACKKETSETETSPKPPSKEYDINGYAQKGPYEIGATVTAHELDNDLNPTGLSYSTVVKSHLGDYEFTDVGFSYNYVKIVVDGSYFHEIRNGVPFGEDLKLEVIADLSKSTEVNINVLTCLQQARLKYLVSKGTAFDKAREQSYDELLKIFKLNRGSLDFPEELNLVSHDYNGAVLFAISNIIANKIGAAIYNIPQVILSLTIDFEKDGTIDETWLQKTLASSALLLDLNEPASNLIDRYSTLGETVNPLVLNKILQDFILQTTYPNITDGIFPKGSGQKVSFFGMEDTIYVDVADSNIFAIDLSQSPQVGMARVTISNASGTYSIPGTSGWDHAGGGRMYTCRQGDPVVNTPFLFTGSGQFTLDILILETNAGPGVFRTKTIIWN